MVYYYLAENPDPFADYFNAEDDSQAIELAEEMHESASPAVLVRIEGDEVVTVRKWH